MAERQRDLSTRALGQEQVPVASVSEARSARHPTLILPEIPGMDPAAQAFIQLRMDELRLISDVFTPLIYNSVGKQFGRGYPMGPEDGICVQYAHNMVDILESIGYVAVEGIHDLGRSTEHRAVLCQRGVPETNWPEPVFLMDGTFKQYRVGRQAPDQMILSMQDYRTMESQLLQYEIPAVMHHIWMKMGTYLPQLGERRLLRTFQP